MAQLRADGFLLSRLAPYESWEQFRDEAIKLWSIYRSIAGNLPVTQIGLRYVNQNDIHTPIRDLNDFVRVYPEVSSDVGSMVSGFLMQIQIPQQDIDALLVLNELIATPAKPEVISLIVNIDLIKQNFKADSEEEIWQAFEILRVRKNMVFEGCITNNTRELIS